MQTVLIRLGGLWRWASHDEFDAAMGGICDRQLPIVHGAKRVFLCARLARWGVTENLLTLKMNCTTFHLRASAWQARFSVLSRLGCLINLLCVIACLNVYTVGVYVCMYACMYVFECVYVDILATVC